MLQNNFKIKPLISVATITAMLFAAIVILGKILIPFLVALILTYIVNPLVEKIQKKFKIQRKVISFGVCILIFLFFILIPLFVIPTIAIQIKIIITKIPALINLVNNSILNTINTRYGTDLTIDLDNLKAALVNNVATLYNHVNLFSPLAKNSFIIVESIVYIILIPFILYYSINNWHQILAFFNSLIPKSYTKPAQLIIKDIDNMLSAYLRGQISVMLIMAVYYALGLHFIGLTSGIIIGTLTGLLVFIPYLGILTGLLVCICIGFAGFQGMHQILAILIVFIVGHILEGGLVTPFLVGGRIGLNPIMIIFALMVFGTLFGFVGVLLALPLSTITVVLLKHANIYYHNSKYYNEEG